MYNLDLINYPIASACILHNFILTEEGDCNEYDEEIKIKKMIFQILKKKLKK